MATLDRTVVVLAVYETLWLSVRHQDPYVGPSRAVIGWVYGVVAGLGRGEREGDWLSRRRTGPRT